MAQISLQLYSIRSRTKTLDDLKAGLVKVRDIGYKAIQGGRSQGWSREENKAFLDSLGLSVTCYGGSLDGIAEDIGGYIDDCHFWGLDEIMIGCLPTEYRLNEDTYRAGVDLMNKVNRQLVREGIYLGYHNHAQEFRRFGDYGKRAIDYIIEDTDPDVHFILDTHWLQAGGGDVIEWMYKVKGRMQYLHVKDYRIAYANAQTGIGEAHKEWAEIGDGALPWPLILQAGEDLGIKAYIVEQDQTYSRDPFDAVKMSYDYLHSLGLD